ncbi:MAG: hypothetical protein IT371_08635 [Deltaproteobacteria bacterium]|nr:hypothetical protein [Deltaproteobacteria bacterium]
MGSAGYLESVGASGRRARVTACATALLLLGLTASGAPARAASGPEPKTTPSLREAFRLAKQGYRSQPGSVAKLWRAGRTVVTYFSLHAAALPAAAAFLRTQALTALQEDVAVAPTADDAATQRQNQIALALHAGRFFKGLGRMPLPESEHERAVAAAVALLTDPPRGSEVRSRVTPLLFSRGRAITLERSSYSSHPGIRMDLVEGPGTGRYLSVFRKKTDGEQSRETEVIVGISGKGGRGKPAANRALVSRASQYWMYADFGHSHWGETLGPHVALVGDGRRLGEAEILKLPEATQLARRLGGFFGGAMPEALRHLKMLSSHFLD